MKRNRPTYDEWGWWGRARRGLEEEVRGRGKGRWAKGGRARIRGKEVGGRTRATDDRPAENGLTNDILSIDRWPTTAVLVPTPRPSPTRLERVTVLLADGHARVSGANVGEHEG